MKVAFYAPLKAPDHPVASGDREIARALMQALSLAGHHVTLASRLRSFDARGDAVRQARLAQIGERVGRRLVAKYAGANRPDIWFTYHLHHKAPDFPGPVVSRALGIPYVVAEASIAPRRRDGAWAAGYACACAAIRGADTVIFVNPADIGEVRKARGQDAPFAMLAPFIDVSRFASRRPARATSADAPTRLITVAMMREGVKLASYRVLAGALALVRDLPFALTIVGDGTARASVESAFARFADRVTFAGARSKDDVAALLQRHDVFVWPAIGEAIGIAFLEAQACALPVIAGATPGVAAVIAAGRGGLVVPAGDVAAFADALRKLIVDAPLRERMRTEAFAHVRAHHDLPAAAHRLDAILHEVVARHRRAHAGAALSC
ncbi:MAG TPA: glycosyltransferase family 4 protein [Casimicrobiaceae bacterium]|nr:glycosyltransferase family 4 protein [Casimicrobiaceae bacterium]